ncbi:MAG: DNA-binding response regulator [Peptococcaceae bacterium]|nr:MAG: DNA-binding response regulator [Peptococcaceae bacterium]
MIVRLKILLVDDRTLFREGLQGFLQANGIEVAGTARDGPEALEKVRLLGPDVVLMDVTGAGRDRLEAIRRIRAENPAVKIVVFADSDENLMAAVQSGACGYLLTSIEGGELLQKLLALERGEVPFSPGLTARVLEGIARQAAEKEEGIPAAEQERAAAAAESGRAGPAAGEGEAAPLTARQKEILDLVAKGLTYRDVGEALGIKERTVKYHIGKIMKLLRLKKREQVIAFAVQKGMNFK